MITYRFFVLLVLVTGPGATLLAQPASGETLTGKLLLKPWTKSIQSYCAQGSDYFVLQLPNGDELVLEGAKPARLKVLTNREVRIDGRRMSKTIKPNPENPLEQRPVGLAGQPEAFTCEVFRVQRLRPAPAK